MATPLAIPEPLRAALRHGDIERLYTHQVEAIAQAGAGRDVLVVTGTASGKSLAYQMPVLETLVRDPEARALFLFPTKALEQDQLKSLRQLLPWGSGIQAGAPHRVRHEALASMVDSRLIPPLHRSPPRRESKHPFDSRCQDPRPLRGSLFTMGKAC